MPSLATNSPFDRRPLIIAVAGPNGAGKSTFCRDHLGDLDLPFVNADVIARELDVDAYEAADLASNLRATLVLERESFIFETVFSDPAGDKLAFLVDAAAQGYTVVLCFIGLEDATLSETRVAAGLASEPFPHFEVAPGRPGLLVRIDEDGTRTIGRFVKRAFVPVKAH